MGKLYGIVLFLGSVLLFLPSPVAAEEICFWESFNASCGAGEVVFIVRAFFGRMHNNRCFNLTQNELSCSTDVQLLLQTHFGLKQSIKFRLASEFFTRVMPSCLQERMPFLDISHQCIKLIGNEVCIQDTFRATCPSGTGIVIQSALYGRMRRSRCIDFDSGNLNCNANVQPFLESLCKGRAECDIRASDYAIIQANGSCSSHLKSYLEVFYACGPVTEPWITDAPRSRVTSAPAVKSPSVSEENQYGDLSFEKKMMIIMPCATVALIIILATFSVFIYKHRKRNQQRTSTSYDEIDEVQPMKETRHGQNVRRVAPKSSLRNGPMAAPLYELALSPSNENLRLPPDSHIYTDLLQEDESKTQPISDATINVPVNLRNTRSASTGYDDIDKVQPIIETRHGQNITRVPPKPSLRNVPMVAPLFESVPSPSIQDCRLPPEPHIYTELLQEDESENQAISDTTISVPVNLCNTNRNLNITVGKVTKA